MPRPVCSLLLFAVLHAPPVRAAEPVAELKALGARLLFDTKAPDKPIVRVDLEGTRTGDADLVLLKSLPRLRDLDLSKTAVTDAGLVHLKDLKQLEHLALGALSRVTDAGLEQLQGLTGLR